MANDRIYLKCRFCGKMEMLWKFYPYTESGGIAANDFVDGPANIESVCLYSEVYPIQVFIRKHIIMCHPRATSNHLNGEPGFTLITESPDGKSAILDCVSEMFHRKLEQEKENE